MLERLKERWPDIVKIINMSRKTKKTNLRCTKNNWNVKIIILTLLTSNRMRNRKVITIKASLINKIKSIKKIPFTLMKAIKLIEIVPKSYIKPSINIHICNTNPTRQNSLTSNLWN